MEATIRAAVEKALAVLGAEGVSFAIERPTDAVHGDYAVNAAMAAAKQLGKNPRELAETLARALEESFGDSVKSVEVAGPGFINITLSESAVSFALSEAIAKGSEWGTGTFENGARVMVEYSNPNAFKEMHIGHLIGSVVGEALSRLIEGQGAVVARDTFGGDVGPHVAKALWALKKNGVTEPASAKQIGEAYAEGSNVYESLPEIKAEIDALNKAIYEGADTALMDLWHRGREVSMEEFRRLWAQLGSKFDFEFFDSDTIEDGLRIVRDGLEKGIFEKSDGAIIYNGEGKGVHTMVFITSHDTPTYEAKDMGLAFLREERWPSDKVIIITGQEQVGRFKTVLAALREMAPGVAEKTKHIATGFLTLTTGKMSSREGSVITAAGFIEEVMQKASEKNPDPLIAEQVAIGAIKYMILRQSPGTDIVFDPEKSLSLEGDSGPYLQYAIVRAKSVIAKASSETSVTMPPEIPLLARLLVHFPEVAERAAATYAPNLLTTYLTELASSWNSFYANERIIGGEYEQYYLKLVRAFVQTMTNGLSLLGIPVPEKM